MEEKNTGQTGCSTLCMLSGKMIKKKDFFSFFEGSYAIFSPHRKRVLQPHCSHYCLVAPAKLV
jgi:hypothetical protein